MVLMPCSITDGKQCDDVAIQSCDRHGDYEGSACQECARIDTKRLAAIAGLESQAELLTQHKTVDKRSLFFDLNRAINFMRQHQ